MILMEFLFAPTVPSEPRPQNFRLFVLFGRTSTGAPSLSEVKVTSSSMPTVKWFFGLYFFMLSKTATIWFGVTSLIERPYLPP